MNDPSGIGTFDNGDVWGMYATVGDSYVLTNSEYTVGTNTLRWSDLSETNPVTFAAYYPRAATVSDPDAYMFNAATAASPDPLVTTPITETKSSGNAVNLTFKHVMKRVNLFLTLKPGGTVVGNVTVSSQIEGWKDQESFSGDATGQ